MLLICSFFVYTVKQNTKIVEVVVIFFITIIVLSNGMAPTPLPSRRMSPASVWWGVGVSQDIFTSLKRFRIFSTYLPRDLVYELKKPYNHGGCNSTNIFKF